MGRLEYQRGNFDAAFQVFHGIDIRGLTPRMTRAIVERTWQRKPRTKGDIISSREMSMHSVSLLLEAILLKAKSLDELGRTGGNSFILHSDSLFTGLGLCHGSLELENLCLRFSCYVWFLRKNLKLIYSCTD